MELETPLAIQHPDAHEPTIEELMLDVAESIRAKDARIAEQRKQLEDVRDALKGILRINAVKNVNRFTYGESTREDGEA